MDTLVLILFVAMCATTGVVVARAAPLRRGDPWRWPWIDPPARSSPPTPAAPRRQTTGGADGFITLMVVLFILSALGSRTPPEEKGDG